MISQAFRRWLKSWSRIPFRHPHSRQHRPPSFRSSLEQLEERLAPANPAVLSIVRAAPAGSLTNAASVAYTVTFNEAVTGVDPTDFQLARTGTVAATLTQVTPASGSAYTVTVSGITGNGTLGLNLVDNGSIKDLNGKQLTAANGSVLFQTQQTFATGLGPGYVALGDVNNDGKPDLVTSNWGGNTVSVLLGNGDGTFQTQKTFATGTNPDLVAVVT